MKDVNLVEIMNSNKKNKDYLKKYDKKNFIQKNLYTFYILIIICCVGLYYFYDNKLKKEPYVYLEGLIVENEIINLTYGQTYKINPIITPEDATNKGIIWTSSDPNLVTVDNEGNVVVVGNQNGEATITAKTNEAGHKVSIKINVTSQSSITNVSGISLNTNLINLEYGKTAKIIATITPENATNKGVTWTSSNPTIVNVDNDGNIKAVSNVEEKVTITAKTNEGNYLVSTEVNVLKNNKINKIDITGVELSTKEISLKYGESIKVDANVYPQNATNKTLMWISSDAKLVSVDNEGNISVVNNENGVATVTVKTYDGSYSDSLKVNVIKQELNQNISVTGLTVDKGEVTLNYGKERKITAIISPHNATNKGVTWTSSDTSTVTVDNNGNIKAIKNKDAKVTVTVKTDNGNYTKNVIVNVKKVDNTIKVTGVKINNDSISLKYKESSTLVATVSPNNATNKAVKWTSSDTSTVTVDNNGNIKAIKNKDTTVTITVKTVQGNYSDSIKVKVKKDTTVKVKSVETNTSSLDLKYGETTKILATILPTNATDKVIEWTSSNNKHVTVDSNGNIKAIKNEKGTVIVKAKTRDGGYEASVKINVIPVISVTNIKLNMSDIQLKKGSNKTIGYTIIPNNATNKNVTWTSSDTTVAKVDKNTGKINAVGNGIATITATTNNGKKSTITVSVINDTEMLSLYKVKNFSSTIFQNFIVNGDKIYLTKKNGLLYEFELSTLEGQICVDFGNDQGHMDSIDIEVTNGKQYLWTGCEGEARSDGDYFAKKLCRMELSKISFSNKKCGNVIDKSKILTTKIDRAGHFAIDNKNRLIIVKSNGSKKWIFKVYKIDDFVKNYNSGKAKVLIEFEVKHEKNIDGKYINAYQNIEFENGDFYIYNGKTVNYSPKNGGKIRVLKYKINTSGKCSNEECVSKIYEKNINYQYPKPNENKTEGYFQEAEGIRIINGNPYIGVVVINYKTKTKRYELYKVNE